jgi:hypothetical protein
MQGIAMVVVAVAAGVLLGVVLAAIVYLAYLLMTIREQVSRYEKERQEHTKQLVGLVDSARASFSVLKVEIGKGFAEAMSDRKAQDAEFEKRVNRLFAENRKALSDIAQSIDGKTLQKTVLRLIESANSVAAIVDTLEGVVMDKGATSGNFEPEEKEPNKNSEWWNGGSPPPANSAFTYLSRGEQERIEEERLIEQNLNLQFAPEAREGRDSHLPDEGVSWAL